MRDNRPLHVLKRKLSFHPFSPKDKKIRSLRSTYSQDSLAVSVYEPAYHKYPVLKLNDNLSLSIGDSFESNPRNSVDVVTKFEYGPIRFPKLFRLLLILPSHDQDEPLETLLFHADLIEVPFQALSYSWGDLTKTKTMHCNGRGMSVTENLYGALLSIRNVGDNKAISIVFVDSVCINQADLKEREAHLKLMRDIYSSSVVTTVWLGSRNEQCTRVFETVDMLHDAVACSEFRDRLEREELDLSSLDHLSIGDRTLHISAENRTELSRFFTHPWFERIWIWQEVVMAKKAFILYGGRVRPWSFFVDAAWCMHKLHWDSNFIPDFFSYGERKMLRHHHVLRLDDHRNGVIDGHTFGLLELLTASRKFINSHPLDRVFGLYGLMGDPKEQEIVSRFFDYTLSPLTLFLNLTINLMISQETLDILHLVHNNPVTKQSWPSFVPDLACQSTGRQLGSRKGRRTWEYQAAGDTRPALRVINARSACTAAIPQFEDDVHIALTGLIIDEVCRHGSEMKETGLNIGTFLADWVNTALMTDGRKFYTMNELKRAREVLKSSATREELKIASPVLESPSRMRRPSLPHIDARRPSIPVIEGRRPSVPNIEGRRPSVPNIESLSNTPRAAHLRNSFAPSLLDALKKIDIEAAPDSPTLPHPNAPDPSHSVMGSLPTDTKYPVGDITSLEAFWRTLIRDQDGSGFKPPAALGKTHFEPWFTAASGSMGLMLEAMQHGHNPDTGGGPRPVPAFNDWIHKASVGSKIFRTRTGYIGTAPRFVEEGDLICILYGGQTPFVLRREAWGNYRFIGDCYVHGIMDGEALSMDLDETEFVLV
jgi:hypothetical protein